MEEVYQFLKDAQTFFFATEDGDQPRVRPFGATMIYENKLYFVTNNQKKVYKQMAANPKVEICAMNAKREWIRIAGIAVTDPNREARVKMFDASASLKNIYTPDDGLMEVFYIKDVTATIEGFGTQPRTIQF